jgi:hypothetical protein
MSLQHLPMEYRHFLIQDSQLLIFLPITGHVMAQAVSPRPITTEDWIQSQASPCRICGGRSDNVTDFSPSTVEPGYNNIGLYDASPIASRYSVVPINSSLLTITLYSSVIMTLVYNNTKYPVPFMVLQPSLTVLQFCLSVSFHRCCILIH